MATPHVAPVPRPEARPSVWASIRLSGLLDMPEAEYRDWLQGLERDPLYARLRSWSGGPVVRREPRAGSRFAWGAVPVDLESLENPLSSLPGLDDELVAALRRLGLSAFERAYLRGEDPSERAAAAAAAGLDVGLAERVARLVDSLWTLDPWGPSPHPEAAVQCVAALERDGDGYAIAYFSPHYLRGRYRVDYEAFSALRRTLAPEEFERARELVRRLELANHKLSALGRVLEALPGLQPDFLAAGEPDSLRPLRQNAFAAELGIAASTVCRALAGRSIRLPQGREVSLVSFFPTTRARTARLIAELAAGRPDASDEELRRELEAGFGLRVTRRLVNLRRRQAAGVDGRREA